ncbi:MAG: AMMECR1 domain-containing protein, partial [Gammaproteobacteria bacterium]|nr:AMMECR1 domain-containing protein [Gammaproteobacteria bacterium]NIR85770.1 AMMECR1 domain-containing protein [Gammaproteobacteria bacterium]
GPGPQLEDEEKQLLLRLARQALHDYLGGLRLPRYSAASAALRERRAAFVTLSRRDSGELRGCRGEAYPYRALVESVMHMAIAAATDDPRFPPVTFD